MFAKIHGWNQTSFKLLTNRAKFGKYLPDEDINSQLLGRIWHFLFNPTPSLPLCFLLCSCSLLESLGHQGEKCEMPDCICTLQKNSRKKTGLRPGLSSQQFKCNFSKCSEDHLTRCHASCKGIYLFATSIWLLKLRGRRPQRWTSERHTVGEGASWGKKPLGSYHSREFNNPGRYGECSFLCLWACEKMTLSNKAASRKSYYTDMPGKAWYCHQGCQIQHFFFT